MRFWTLEFNLQHGQVDIIATPILKIIKVKPWYLAMITYLVPNVFRLKQQLWAPIQVFLPIYRIV